MAMSHQQKSISKSCEQILESVRTSSLNYSSRETPFSLYLTIRKSSVKAPNSSHQTSVGVQSVAVTDAENFLKTVIAENAQLKEALKQSFNDLEVSREALKKRDYEVEQCREEQKNKDSDFDTLKCVVKKKNAELDTLNSELKKAKQTLKSRDKEVYNLENVKMNNLDKIKALKDDFNKLKKEKTVLEKQIISK